MNADKLVKGNSYLVGSLPGVYLGLGTHVPGAGDIAVFQNPWVETEALIDELREAGGKPKVSRADYWLVKDEDIPNFVAEGR